MTFTFNGNPIFINKTAAAGNVVTESVILGQVYKLTLNDVTEDFTWSSDPALNSDGDPHLALTNTFSDFPAFLAIRGAIPLDHKLRRGGIKLLPRLGRPAEPWGR